MIRTRPLDDLISQGVLSLQTGPFGSQLHSHDYVDSGIPVIPTEGIQNGRIDHTVLPQITSAKWAELARHEVVEDDILFARRGAQATGRTALIRQSERGFICGTGAIRARVLDRTVLNPRFLAWFLANPTTVSWIREHAIGATMPNLNKSIIGRIEVLLLPADEQREIAAILGALDDKIELNRKTAAVLEEMARALYRSWFVDFDPVRARSEGRAPAHMDEPTAALFPDSFGEDGLPVGWATSRLGVLCHQVKQTVKPMEAAEADFWHFSLPAFDAGKTPAFERGAQIRSNKLYVPNDAILFSRLNPSIPRVWWARSDHDLGVPAASTEFFVAVSRRTPETPWLYCLLSSPEFQEQAVARVTGTSNSHQRVSASALSDIEVVEPAADIIAEFGDMTADWFERIQTLAAENRTLATLRDTLLPRLMSGELRVSAAREMIEEVA